MEPHELVQLSAQCGRRALTTSNAQCVCAVLGQLNNLLTTALYPQLHAKLEVSYSISAARRSQATPHSPYMNMWSCCHLKPIAHGIAISP